MMNPIVLFDYVFYRTHVFFQKKNDDLYWFKSVLVVTFLDFCIVGQALYLAKSFIFFSLPTHSKYLIGVPLFVLVLLLNSLRYGSRSKKHSFSALHERWGSKDRKTVRRDGWLIVLLIVFIVFAMTAVTAMVYKASGQSVPR